MSVNYIKLGKASSKYHIAAIERTLREGAFCAEQLAEQLNITRRRINEYIRRLRDENKIHIHKYESILAERHKYPVAFYIYGAGIDAVRSAKTKAECAKEYRVKLNADPKRKAKAKKKRQAYEKKIKTNPEYRTVYENKLWRDRRRKVRCDIAASWIK